MTKYDLLPEFKHELQSNLFMQLKKLSIPEEETNQIVQSFGNAFERSEWKHFIERELFKRD